MTVKQVRIVSAKTKLNYEDVPFSPSNARLRWRPSFSQYSRTTSLASSVATATQLSDQVSIPGGLGAVFHGDGL